MQWLEEASSSAGYQLGKDVGVLIDVGAERLYDPVRGKCWLMCSLMCVASLTIPLVLLICSF